MNQKRIEINHEDTKDTKDTKKTFGTLITTNNR